MAVTVEGSTYMDISAANASTASITVPAGTELIVAHWEFLRPSAAGMTSLLYGAGDDPFTIVEERETDGNYVTIGVGTLVPGATGSQPVDWNIDGTGAPTEGGFIFYHFLSNLNTTVVDVGVHSVSGIGTACATTVAVGVGDFISGTAQRYQTGSDLARVTQTVSAYDQSDITINSIVMSLFRLDEADATSETFTVANPDYSSVSAIAFSPASGGGGAAQPVRRGLTLMGVGSA